MTKSKKKSKIVRRKLIKSRPVAIASAVSTFLTGCSTNMDHAYLYARPTTVQAGPGVEQQLRNVLDSCRGRLVTELGQGTQVLADYGALSLTTTLRNAVTSPAGAQWVYVILVDLRADQAVNGRTETLVWPRVFIEAYYEYNGLRSRPINIGSRDVPSLAGRVQNACGPEQA